MARMVKRYNLTLPVTIFDEVQALAERQDVSILEVLRRFIRLGLILTQAVETSKATLVLRHGEHEREVLWL